MTDAQRNCLSYSSSRDMPLEVDAQKTTLTTARKTARKMARKAAPKTAQQSLRAPVPAPATVATVPVRLQLREWRVYKPLCGGIAK